MKDIQKYTYFLKPFLSMTNHPWNVIDVGNFLELLWQQNVIKLKFHPVFLYLSTNEKENN